jgi:hypothetical protein
MFTLTCSKTVRSKGSHADVNALFCVCAGWSIHQLAKRTANKRLPSHIPAGDFGFSRFLSPGAHLFRTHEWLRFRFRFRFRSAAADGLINGRERERDLPDQKHIGNSWSACHHRKPSRAPFSMPVTIVTHVNFSATTGSTVISFVFNNKYRNNSVHVYLSNKDADNTAIINAHAKVIGVEDTCTRPQYFRAARS